MQLALNPRARRLLRFLPVSTPYALVRAFLILAVAVQSARLFWTLIAPLGPVGEWRAVDPLPPADRLLLARFDPFFRLAPTSGAVAVTSLPLKLFGTRLDTAVGRGSAIIATPDGVQSSFAVGDTIIPGVILRSVSFDNVTIDRGGALEQIFIDQTIAPRAVVGGPPAVTATAAPPPVAQPPQPIPGVSLSPVGPAGSVNGLMVSGNADDLAFKASGLQPGDVVTAVNGTPVSGADAASRALATPSAGGIVALTVKRGNQTVTVNAQGPAQ